MASIAPEDPPAAAAAAAAAAASSAASPLPSAKLAKQIEQREAWAATKKAFDEWLALTPEEALEPELEIVDPHHHLWDMRALKGFNFLGLMRQQLYLTDELLDDMVGGGHNVTHTVYAEAHSFHNADVEDKVMAPLGEVQAAQGVAAQFASGSYGPLRAAAGIVGTADLAKYGAGAAPLLEACKAQCPNFRGVRCTAAYDERLGKPQFLDRPGLYKEATFREGFALLEAHGLSFDAWCFSAQLGDVLDLALAFPGTTIVLNHCGTPVGGLGPHSGVAEYEGKEEEIMAEWRANMARIAAECPNVCVKVGAGGFPHVGAGFNKREKAPTSEEVAETFKSVYLYVIETFGCDRCMFEGNFPVDKVSMSYTVLWNAFKRITADFPTEDRAKLFSGTAKRVYRLG
jgi:L-fuconolactonase